MRFIESLCPPAFLYFLYVAVFVGALLARSHYYTAGLTLLSGGVGVFLLDAFCRVDIGIVSWVIISTPFVMTALAVTIAMGLQLDKTLSKVAEKFTPLTADNEKNRDKRVTQLKGGEAPVPSNI